MLNCIDGVLLLNKPKHISSNQAVQKVKRMFNLKKIGHTGTLDPLASGLLPLCLGEATKFANYLLNAEKEYVATIQLGHATDTFDAEGVIIASSANLISIDDVKSILNEFVGDIVQIPPKYSAIKYLGRPLYKYAVEGVEIPIKARKVHIANISINEFNYDAQTLCITVRCSKGTYIRSLANDIGYKLNSYAFLKELTRTKSHVFSLTQALTFDELEIICLTNTLHTNLLKIDVALENLPKFIINDIEYSKIQFGNACEINLTQYMLNQTVKIYFKEEFLGIGNIIDNKLLQPIRMINFVR